MDNNAISWSLEAGGGVFGGLTALTSLSLANNSLQSLSEDVFAGLEALTSLELRGNNVSSVHESALSHLDALTAL